MRWPRFRVRTYMLGVGFVALLLWGLLMGGWAFHYHERAMIYGAWEREWREMARRDLDRGATQTVAARWGVQIAGYYAPLARKYRRAMWRPWVSVDPDPPPPTGIEHRPPYLQ